MFNKTLPAFVVTALFLSSLSGPETVRISKKKKKKQA